MAAAYRKLRASAVPEVVGQTVADYGDNLTLLEYPAEIFLFAALRVRLGDRFEDRWRGKEKLHIIPIAAAGGNLCRFYR